jgi:hypothetical protein
MMRILASIAALTLTAGVSYSVSSTRLVESNDTHFQVAVDEITTSAREQGVEIRSDQVSYASLGQSFLVHAPITGADQHTEEDFAKGVNVGFLFTRSVGSLPSDFYTVRAIIPLGAAEGEAQFINAAGDVVRTNRLVVRSVDEEEAFNPTPVDLEPPGIPNITSTHIYKNGKWYVDCAGWTPYRVIYYPVS